MPNMKCVIPKGSKGKIFSERHKGSLKEIQRYSIFLSRKNQYCKTSVCLNLFINLI